jgi:protein-tyrosine-phosphatase
LSRLKFQVLLVCTGNTCRSAMAEGILKSFLEGKGESDIIVSSAGIGALEDYPASDFAVEAAGHWDVDISSHRARQLNHEMIKTADLILAMSSEHADYVLRAEPRARSKTYLLKSFPVPYAPSQEGVKDPIGGSLDQYNQTFLELDETIRRIEADIIRLSKSSKIES